VSVSTRSVGDAISAVAGPEAVTADPAFTVDGVRPRWHVAPAGIDEMAAVVSLARDTGLSVCPLGSGSTQELGAPLGRADIALDLRRLDGILEDHPEDLTISVQAGVTLAAVRTRLAARRQLLPIDPPGGAARTVGGIAATHAQGPLRARYRTVRDLLLGVRFVQADGVLTWGGARVVKSVTGYDIPKLMVGSLGTLGILTELTLRLHPMPDVTRTWVAAATSIDQAADLVARLVDSAIQPNRVEWLNRPVQAAVGLDAGPAAIAVSIGSVEEAVRAQGAMLTSLAEASDTHVSAVPETFWYTYETAVSPAARRVALKISTLPTHVVTVAKAVEIADATATLSGCAALGVLHVGVGEASAAALVERLRGLVGEHGGSVVVARGPRELRARVDAWGPLDDGGLEVMRGLKRRFDPTGVLNPGRFVGGI
jgi:glycolate oxidase FAD binding subunit